MTNYGNKFESDVINRLAQMSEKLDNIKADVNDHEARIRVQELATARAEGGARVWGAITGFAAGMVPMTCKVIWGVMTKK